MKLAIGIPYHDNFSVPLKFFESLVKAIPVLYQNYQPKIFLRTGTLISLVRNQILADAIKGDYDYMLWLDSDMRFEPEDITRILERAKEADIVTGLYFSDKPHLPNIFLEIKGGLKGAFRTINDYKKDSVFSIDAAGFGFLIMNRKVIYGMPENPFNEMSIKGFHIGEDLSFFTRAKERGFKVLCDSSIKLGHLRVKEINEDNWLDGVRTQ